MAKMKYLISLIGCLGICMLTQAGTASDMNGNELKTTLSGGIKADAVFLNFLKKSAPDIVSGLTPGGAIGGFVRIDFNETFGLRPEFNLTYKQNDLSWISDSGHFRSMGIEIPVYVTAGWNVFKAHRIFVGIGPYTEFCYLARWERDGRKVDLLKLNEAGEPMIQDSQSGFGAIVSYMFGCGLSIEISYRMCCYNILQPNTSQGVSLFPQTIGFGLGFDLRRKR